MSYNANFSVTQSIDCATITITDTSSNTSSEVITNRKIYLQKTDGTYLQPLSQTVYIAPVSALGSFALITIPTVGTTGVYTVYDPILGQINFTYVSLISDNTLAILSTSFAAAITVDPRGYTASYSASTGKITVYMPASYGATGNYNGTPNTTGYFDVLNFLRNNIVYFAGGVNYSTAVQTGLNYYDFSPFLFPSNQITIPLLQDYAVSVQLVSTPKTVVIGSVYSISKLLSFTCNIQTFRLARISDLASIPAIINNLNYKSSLYNLTLYIDNANLAIGVGDIASCQSAIDSAYFLINNQTKFF